jgi:hypothetical protein
MRSCLPTENPHMVTTRQWSRGRTYKLPPFSSGWSARTDRRRRRHRGCRPQPHPSRSGAASPPAPCLLHRCPASERAGAACLGASPRHRFARRVDLQPPGAEGQERHGKLARLERRPYSELREPGTLERLGRARGLDVRLRAAEGRGSVAAPGVCQRWVLCARPPGDSTDLTRSDRCCGRRPGRVHD